MDFLKELNPQRREAVSHTEGPLLILASRTSSPSAAFRHRRPLPLRSPIRPPLEMRGVDRLCDAWTLSFIKRTREASPVVALTGTTNRLWGQWDRLRRQNQSAEEAARIEKIAIQKRGRHETPGLVSL
jgi:hypothetical protein